MKINGEAFRKAREARLLGTHHLAKAADVSPGCIQGLESAGRARLSTLRKIIAALGMSIQEAYDRKFLED